jgi:hypothetical protein
MHITPEVARELAEAERALIRAWDLQQRERAEPHAETVTDDQIDRSATLLEQLAEYLPADERDDIERLIGVVRIRLELKAEQQ